MAADQMMENNSDHEDQEALIFHSYPYAAYYVQSPSTLSHTNSVNAVDVRNLHSTTSTHSSPANDAVSGFTTLSRYSSNDEDVLSLLKGHKTKMIGVIPGGIHQKEGAINRLIIVDHDDEDDDDDEDDENNDGGKKKRGCWWRYMSFRRSDNNACGWIALQIFWRLLFSLGVALLVFYIATNPPHPNISIKISGIREFGLGEGVDGHGLATKILTCNCSMDLTVDNNSRLFGLHIHPPIIQMSFAHFPFAFAHGPKLYAQSHGSTVFKLYIGTRSKPMYGAGRNMQDMLESGKGLPLLIRVSFSSDFRVVWSLINPKFHHQAQCLLLIHPTYDKKHKTQKYNSTCITM
ncbi:uncharacterized protein LOC110818985 [Carica papaya]|uniref:uncharacterized protein LOC110818985 n=1 Tax=Carica papaya TaxID=3649 RepID=UPI000B8CF17C|nr:uncharacterized protein LOC110818985 [Carica papaya]